MIEVTDLTKTYGDRHAIDKLNFQIQKGEVVGFLGPNGAGKSTTMKIVTGYMAPSSGQVKVADHDVFEEPVEVKRRIGYLPEAPPVYTDMYVMDYLEFVARLRKVPSNKVASKVQSTLEKTNLGDVSRRLIGHLSKGYRQRVGLAQALVSDPEILILDEPTVGLDPRQVAEMRSLIHQLKGDHTVILSTHILPEVQANCERVIIIHNGHIIAKDTLSGLSEQMSGGRRVLLRVRRDESSLTEQLNKIDGVKSADQEGGQWKLDVGSEEQTIEEIASCVVQSGAGLVELKVESMNLEDIFIKLTSTDAVAQA